jgi:hypothetical protein
MARCAAIKASGERCKAEATPEAEWCWSHHPDHAAERRRRASKGGKRGGRGRPQAELAALKDKLIALGDDVLEERVDRSAGAVAAQIWNVAIGAIRTGLKAKEVEELQAQVEELEALMQQQREGGRRGA